MMTMTERRNHPQADRDCGDCKGSGYAVSRLDPLDANPQTEVCDCVLRRLEQGQERRPTRHGRPR